MRLGTHIVDVPDVRWFTGTRFCGDGGSLRFTWKPAPEVRLFNRDVWYSCDVMKTGQITGMFLRFKNLGATDVPGVFSFLKELEKQCGGKFVASRGYYASSRRVKGENGEPLEVKTEFMPFDGGFEGAARDWKRYAGEFRVFNVKLASEKSEVDFFAFPESRELFSVSVSIRSCRYRQFSADCRDGKVKIPFPAWEENIPLPVAGLPPDLVKKMRGIQYDSFQWIREPIAPLIAELTKTSDERSFPDTGIQFKLEAEANLVDQLPQLYIQVGSRSLLEILEMICRTAELSARAEEGTIILTPVKR